MPLDSVDAVKSLRERTGAGIMDCKAALQSSSGDVEKAIDFLRKKGMAQAVKRAGREAKEGCVAVRADGVKVALVEANCETDFVARTEDFKNLVTLSLEESLAHGEKAISSDKISQKISELSGKIGEKILIRRVKVVESKDSAFFTYIHSNQKLGVIVELGVGRAESQKNPALTELGKNLAMQVAASNPIGITRTDIPTAVVDREKAIFQEEVKGKPENILEKIIQGKLGKFYQSSCLLEQPFIKDDKVSVKQLIDAAAKSCGDSIQVKQFVRFQLGESLPS